MKTHHITLSALLAICLTACEKQGEILLKPINKVQTFHLFGFALVDTIEQYFDGRKVRELSGRYSYDGNIAFDKEGPTVMEFKKKGDSKVLFSKTITQSQADADKRITFYYDGNEVKEKYTYPAPIANIEQFAFYFDAPANVPVDVVYSDASGDINAIQYLARNVQPHTWTNFIQVPPLNGNGQDLYIFLLKAGKKEWLAKDGFQLSYVQANLPVIGGGYQGGGVQGLYIRIVSKDGLGVGDVTDLVQVYQ